MDKEIYNQLKSIVGDKYVLADEPMRNHTTFQVGGKADYYVMPHTMEEIKNLILFFKKSELPFCVIGNGSNLLVSDLGYHGAILHILENLNTIQVNGNLIQVQAGALLSAIAEAAYDAGLKNFEFASGIPGTIGGAAVMNAGAYGGEMKQVLKSVTVIDREGNVFELSKDELKLGYRTSIIATNDYVVLEVCIELEPGDPEEIKKLLDDYTERRAEKQPLEFPSAGSTFKRPEGYFAGKLIMDAGLRGFSIGGAQVSEKHCGFVINKGDATAADIIKLIHHVQEQVEKQFGVKLETEVKMLGEF
ncbi:UDP-N-acetylmuramate dehydrogenase [Konateibacter massiliensis]|uniref:UDP-N-acetylmuramate dehydrogenase n=1 Tax=Konateibacter massiliensis TaxID=2002841 RepID=UPI000C15CDB6|nr:UDP-N-acetylmuramate dehydrogenase [Konateibacter massiliensis]